MHATAAGAQRRWRNVPVVRERDPHRATLAARVLMWILAAAAPLGFYVVQQMNHVRVRYKIEEIRAQNERLVEAERRLRIERAAIEALPHVEARALHELGLVRPSASQVVVLKRVRPDRDGHATRSPDGAGRGR